MLFWVTLLLVTWLTGCSRTTLVSWTTWVSLTTLVTTCGCWGTRIAWAGPTPEENAWAGPTPEALAAAADGPQRLDLVEAVGRQAARQPIDRRLELLGGHVVVAGVGQGPGRVLLEVAGAAVVGEDIPEEVRNL